MMLTCSFISIPVSPCSCVCDCLSGNVLACNYVRGGRNCYLLESQASGVTVRGGACIGSTNGIVVNGGKRYELHTYADKLGGGKT